MATTSMCRSAAAAVSRLSPTTAAAHQAAREWNERGIALFRVGVVWDVVKLPSGLVHAVAGGDELELVRARLEEFEITGPVFFERGVYYALVPPGTAAAWDQGVECVTTTAKATHYMGVPAPHRAAGPWAHWVVPPSGSLCSPAAVRALVAAGAELLAEEGPSTQGAAAHARGGRQ